MQPEDKDSTGPGDRKRGVEIGRYLVLPATILVLLILWRFSSPYSLPRLAERMGDGALKLWSQP